MWEEEELDPRQCFTTAQIRQGILLQIPENLKLIGHRMTGSVRIQNGPKYG